MLPAAANRSRRPMAKTFGLQPRNDGSIPSGTTLWWRCPTDETARCDDGLAARLSISPTRVRFPSASLQPPAVSRRAHGRQPDTVSRAALLTRASPTRRCGFESHAFRLKQTTAPQPDGETDDHASLRTRGSRFESWSGCLLGLCDSRLFRHQLPAYAARCSSICCFISA